jgi:hypothetical protein
MEQFIVTYWPHITFGIMTVFGFGKGWQSMNQICRTLKEHSIELKIIHERESLYCQHIECEKFRNSCAARNDKQFAEIKGMLNAMDSKRENSRDDAQALLADISCRMGRIEGKLESRTL